MIIIEPILIYLKTRHYIYYTHIPKQQILHFAVSLIE